MVTSVEAGSDEILIMGVASIQLNPNPGNQVSSSAN